MKRILLCVTILCLLLSGCNFDQVHIEGLISPPKLSDTQNQIYQALIRSTGKNIQLVYPKSGDYKTAFILQNIDEEPGDEALVFYQKKGDALSSVRIKVLDQQESIWTPICDESSISATEVNQISFLTKDEKTYIIVSFQQSGINLNSIEIYQYENRTLSSFYRSSGSGFAVYDMNADGQEEVIILLHTLKAENQQDITAQMYAIREDGLALLSTESMNESVLYCTDIYKGYLDNGAPALYFDEQISRTISATEILTVQNGILHNLMFQAEESFFDNTKRSYALDCMDLDQDQVYEVPLDTLFPGYSDPSLSQQLSRTDWYHYNLQGKQLVFSTYTDTHLHYHFHLPQSWLKSGRITAKKDSIQNEITFYLFEHDLASSQTPLASIRVVTKNDEQTPLQEGYSLLKVHGQLSYYGKVYAVQSDLAITQEQLQNNLQLIL